MSEMKVVALKTLDAGEKILKSNCCWPDQTEGQAADFREVEYSIVQLRGQVDIASNFLLIGEKERLSVS